MINARLQASIEVKENPDGTCELHSPFLGKRFGISSNQANISSLLKDLQNGVSYPEEFEALSSKYGFAKNFLNTIYSKLKENKLLIEEEVKVSSPQQSLYDRQIRFFRSFENKDFSGEELHENLQHRTIVIVGLGGYGSWTALLCARMGVKNIIGIDFDHVEITNLHRQILYNRKDLGKLKTEACKQKILECDESINFKGYDLKVEKSNDLHAIVEEADLVLNPFSYVPPKNAALHPAGIVAKAALDMNKPCITFGGSWVGPLTLPGKSPCYFCAIRELSQVSELDPEQRNPHIQKRAFAPLIAACCSLAVFEASRFLSGCDDPQILKGIMQPDILSFFNNRFFNLNQSNECNFCYTHSFISPRTE